MKRIAYAVLAALLLTRQGTADDTDIYLNAGTGTGSEALVMFSLDWRPNLGSTVCQGGECQELIDDGYLVPANPNQITFFELLRATLEKVLEPLTGLKVGLMINHADNRDQNCVGLNPMRGSNPVKCSNGGYILSGFRSVESESAMAEFFAKLDNLPVPQGNESHFYQGRELFFEFFRYLTGEQVFSGHNGWLDFNTDVTHNINDPDDKPPASAAYQSWDTTIESNDVYISPLVDISGCSGIFTINIMFQVSQQEADFDSNISASKDEGGMEGINLQGNRKQFDTVLEYLFDVDLSDGTFGTVPDHGARHNVTSYFLVDADHVNTTTNGYASAGGTGSALPLSENPDELYETINDIFREILSVSTTFTAPSIPVNVFNRAEALDEVFISLFQADADGLPLWPGNLKKLTIGEPEGGGNPELHDQLGAAAVAPDGRIRNTALTYWSHQCDLPPPTDPNEEFVADRDGRTVTRGGAGCLIQQHESNAPADINGENTRKLFIEPLTYTNGTPAALTGFDATEEHAEILLANDDLLYRELMGCMDCDFESASSADQAAAIDHAVDLVRFNRGADVTDADDDDSSTDARPWMLSDSLHSRPLPLNYGVLTEENSTANPEVRIVMGSNDGFLRMFDADNSSGVESWAFMPRELLHKTVRLRQNSVGIPAHPYLLDGEPRALVVDNDGDGNIEAGAGDRVIAYIGMRRGGKSLFAVDITDPDDPKLLWRIAKDGGDIAELGQSWSPTRAIRLKVGSVDDDTIGLLFAGGYNGDDDGDKLGDLGKDARDDDALPPHVGSDDDEGNAIFIVDALDGSLIWKAVQGGTDPGPVVGDPEVFQHPHLVDSIPAEIAVIDTDGNGLHDRFYVGDTGGTIWRGDIAGFDRSSWSLTRLATVGRHFSDDAANDRRIHHRVDFVQAQDGLGTFDAVLVGTGDRPHPLGENTVNYFYMIKDRNVTSGVPPDEDTQLLDHDSFADLTDNCLQDTVDFQSPAAFTGCADDDAQAALANGWRIKLEQCEGGSTGLCGEKNLSSPLVIEGTVFFTTYLPPQGTEEEAQCAAPAEGSGLFYAVSLQTAAAIFDFDTTNNTGDTPTLDRFEPLIAGGIPSQPLPAGEGRILRSDLTIITVPGATGAKTFWYERLLR